MLLENQRTTVDEHQETFDLSLPHGVIQSYHWGVLSPGHVKKTWGYETIHINTGLYCLKELVIFEGLSTSKHFHIRKHETLLCTKGKIVVSTYNKDHVASTILEVGDSFVVVPGLVHSLGSLQGDSILVEASTFSQDEDSIRL